MTSIRRHSSIWISLLLPVLCLCILCSCNHSTKPKTASVSGQILLINDINDPAYDLSDYSGFTVALYAAVDLDNTISRISSQHPEMGIQVNQFTEFDHRLFSPIRIVVTDPMGSFKFDNISYGVYNVVVFKQGWGYQYLYSVSVNSPGVTISEPISIYPLRILSGTITEATTWLADRVYRISGDLIVVGSLMVDAGAKILIDPFVSVTIHGELNLVQNAGEHVLITSSDGIYSLSQKLALDISSFDSFTISENASVLNGVLSNLLVSFSSNGVIIRKEGLEIRDSHFSNNYRALGIFNTELFSLKSSVVRSSGNPTTQTSAIIAYGASQLMIQNIVALANHQAIYLHTTSGAVIQNSWFQGNSLNDVTVTFESNAQIMNCEFRNSNVAIESSGSSTSLITFNNISGAVGILNTSNGNWFPSWFTANNNNFDCAQYAVRTKAQFWNPPIVYLDAKNNYWSTSSSSEVSELIWDYDDEDPNDPIYIRYQGLIDYIPFRTNRVLNAGIQP